MKQELLTELLTLRTKKANFKYTFERITARLELLEVINDTELEECIVENIIKFLRVHIAGDKRFLGYYSLKEDKSYIKGDKTENTSTIFLNLHDGCNTNICRLNIDPKTGEVLSCLANHNYSDWILAAHDSYFKKKLLLKDLKERQSFVFSNVNDGIVYVVDRIGDYTLFALVVDTTPGLPEGITQYFSFDLLTDLGSKEVELQ